MHIQEAHGPQHPSQHDSSGETEVLRCHTVQLVQVSAKSPDSLVQRRDWHHPAINIDRFLASSRQSEDFEAHHL